MAIIKKQCIKIGYVNCVKKLDAEAQVNILRIGSKFDTVDGWYGAMGNGTLKVCVQGFTSLTESKDNFNVERIGFYLKDTYDFVDEGSISEPLGIWSENRILDKTESAFYLSSYASSLWGELVRDFSGFVPVFNEDFRIWQKNIIQVGILLFYPMCSGWNLSLKIG